MSVLVIAEIGSVHDGSFGNALRLIDLAAECGAGAVKFQTHIAAAETLRDAPPPPYFQGEPRYEYFQRTGFALPQWAALKQHAESLGLVFLSSPFSAAAVELLEAIGIQQYKIPSGEVTNLPLLAGIARTGKPVLLSSGMSSWDELDRAVATIRQQHDRLTVLQCTSEYPCRPEHVGLNVMQQMQVRYAAPVGLSDHTSHNYASFAAVTLGATVIEKHLAFSRRMYGSDARHSLEPAEFRDLTDGIRAIATMVHSPVEKSDIQRFATMKQVFEKSVTTTQPITAGTVLTADMLALRKPGTGIPAAQLAAVLGLPAAHDLAADVVLQWSDLQTGAPVTALSPCQSLSEKGLGPLVGEGLTPFRTDSKAA